MSNKPLWTPQAFAVALKLLRDTGMDSTEAFACVVATMLRQYEAKIVNLQAAWELRGVHLDAAHDRIATLENAIVASGETLRAIRDEIEGGNDE